MFFFSTSAAELIFGCFFDIPSSGKTTISNDGATIMKLLDVVHPAAKTLVDISLSQDAEVCVVSVLACVVGCWQKCKIQSLHACLVGGFLDEEERGIR